MMRYVLTLAAGSDGPHSWTVTAIATVMAATVTLIVGLLASITTWRVARNSRNASRRQAQSEYRLRQLNEFYEPFAMLRIKAKHLRKSLPQIESDGSIWRLVHHIPEIKSDPGRARIVDEIVAINSRTEDLLINKAGLMEGPPSLNFEKFMHHSALLTLAWQHGRELVTSGQDGVRVEEVPFPTELDDDLDSARSQVRAALNALIA